MYPRSVLALSVVLLMSCSQSQPAPAPQITVAAASDLTQVFTEVGRAFTARTGVKVVFSFGSTAKLATQIENGAPFDLYAAADTEHVDSLVTSRKLIGESRAVYALGQLAVWIPKGGTRTLEDLTTSDIRYIAIAQPESAPYGKSAVEAMKRAGLYERLQRKLVYAENVNQAKQLAATGNADASFTAYSLVLHERGTVMKVDRGLYRTMVQAAGVVADSPRSNDAARFRTFLLSLEGRKILTEGGYLTP